MASKLTNPANLLTLSRFALAPVMLWFAITLTPPGTPSFCAWAALAMLIVLIAALLTDLFDGMVARSLGVVTDFGKIMDPVADSTFFMTLLFSFSASPRLRESFPMILPLIVLWREVLMHVLRRYAALAGIVLAAKWSGKLKTASQGVLLCLVLLAYTVSDMGWYSIAETTLSTLAFYSGVFIAAVNVLSMIEYLRDFPELIEARDKQLETEAAKQDAGAAQEPADDDA